MSSEVPSGMAIFQPEFLQTRMAVKMAKGLRITPFLNRQTVPSRSLYTYFYEEATAEGDITTGAMGKPYRVAPGASLTPIRISDLDADSKPVEVRGFELIVEDQKMKEQGQSVLRFMERMAYRIGREVESDNNTLLSAAAAASTASLVDGNWDDSTAIGRDIIRMQEAFQDDSLPDELTGLFYESVNHRELREFLDDVGVSDVIYNNQNDLTYKGTRHIYGGRNMTHGTAIGFDLTNPPATVAYGTVEGAASPQVLQGMEGFAPILNVKVSPVDPGDLYPKTKIQMSTETTLAVELLAALLAQTGL